jgi:hypothetical protein
MREFWRVPEGDRNVPDERGSIPAQPIIYPVGHIFSIPTHDPQPHTNSPTYQFPSVPFVGRSAPGISHGHTEDLTLGLYSVNNSGSGDVEESLAVLDTSGMAGMWGNNFAGDDAGGANC